VSESAGRDAQPPEPVLPAGAVVADVGGGQAPVREYDYGVVTGVPVPVLAQASMLAMKYVQAVTQAMDSQTTRVGPASSTRIALTPWSPKLVTSVPPAAASPSVGPHQRLTPAAEVNSADTMSGPAGRFRTATGQRGGHGPVTVGGRRGEDVVRFVSRRVWWIAGAALLAVAVVTALMVVLGHGERRLPPPRARQYRSIDACLLTGPGGVADPQASAVWAGMQDASVKTRARVSYLPVVGPDTVTNALPFAQSLIQRHCAVILAVGQVETGAAAKEAPQHADIRFVLIGQSASGANVSVVPAGTRERVRPAVADVVTHFVGD
jgi:hypothetical protein